MKSVLLVLLVVCPCAADELAPPRTELTAEEIGRWIGKVNPATQVPKSIIRRGLISGQTALRADCARYLATHGNLSDVPYLIESLADDSHHVGATYTYGGMATTRYWANVALIAITKEDHGFRWDEPAEKRRAAIQAWKRKWERVSSKVKKDEIREAVLRHQFDMLKARREPHFVKVEDGDPSADLMSRLKRHQPTVVGESHFKMGSGVRFSLGQVEMLGDGRARVQVARWSGDQGRAIYQHTVERKGGQWIVKESALISQS